MGNTNGWCVSEVPANQNGNVDVPVDIGVPKAPEQAAPVASRNPNYVQQTDEEMQSPTNGPEDLSPELPSKIKKRKETMEEFKWPTPQGSDFTVPDQFDALEDGGRYAGERNEEG
jgi:hypothetical protein